MLGFPVKLHGTPCEVRLPAPKLGEHTGEVLASMALTAEEIRAVKGVSLETGGRPARGEPA
jgi:crotonobetainyl-CoA:carnitine CoA-transferase CaiB-like acyl-CoA transferase